MVHSDITKTQYKVSDFLGWQRNGTLVLSPSFQRRPVWPPGAKSYLIDTILRGLPIPIIFLREQKTDFTRLEPKREVVDGQQRLRTLISFIMPACLADYLPDQDDFRILKAHNKDLADKGFNDLIPELKQRILDYQFSVHVFATSVDDREILQIFARLNSTGYKLNGQELRNARFFGEFKTSMFALAAAQLARWRKWNLFTEASISRMQEVELTSEFGHLILKGITGKSQQALNKIYRDYNDTFNERAEIERRFETIMNLIDDNVGNGIANTAFQNRAAFYGLFASTYDLVYGIGSKLSRSRAARLRKDFRARVLQISKLIESGSVPEDVSEGLARRTTHKESRQAVVDYLTKQLRRA